MKVDTEISPYRINGVDTVVGNKLKLHVKNVWNARRLVELEFDGARIVVHEAELIKAIANATNNEVK